MTAKRQPRSNASRDRLEEMITLVQSYRGWSQKQVAETLNRNVHALVPDSGNPKLDLVVTLSRILDWPIEMVVADLRAAEVEAAAQRSPSSVTPSRDPAGLIREAWSLTEAERWDDVLAATDPEAFEGLDGETRAHLLVYRQIALESMGQYLGAIECCRLGLEHVAYDSEVAYRLRSALAYLLLVTGSLHEAEGIAIAIIFKLTDLPSESPRRERLAFAHFVRGMSSRLLAVRGGSTSVPQLREARDHLLASAAIFDEFRIFGGSERDAAQAVTARSAAREVEVLLGDASPNELVEEVIASLDLHRDLASTDSSAAESLGWRCVFAARVILAAVKQFPEPERSLAILTNKADEVAERLGHWALREQIFTLEHLHRVLSVDSGDEPPAWNLDEDDVRVLMGTMGRFPHFRRIGWRILDAVRQERKEGLT